VVAAADVSQAAAAPEVSETEFDLDDTADIAPAQSATASVRRRPAPGAAGSRRGKNQ